MSEVKDDIRPWARHAACNPQHGHDAAWWFPQPDWSRLHPHVKAAKEVCKGCPVKDECLQYAMEHEAFGIWGGFTEHQREALRRESGMPVMKTNTRRRMNAKNAV